MNAPKQTTVYPYQNENKELLYSKVRHQDSDGSKHFYFEREENGVTVRNINGVKKVLYRLPYVLHAIAREQTLFLVEGEKDANTLLRNKLFATTTSGTLEWCDDYTALLKNADVVILYDSDKTGLQRRDLLCEKLYDRVKRLRVVDLPGLEYKEKHGQDISDWLSMDDNTIERFLTMVEQTPDYVFKPNIVGHSLVTVGELMQMEIPAREMIVSPFLPTQGLAMIVAKRGVGKTHVALGIAYAVATGSDFLCWNAPKCRSVLYVDGEMPASLMQERLEMIANMTDKNPGNRLQIMTPDLQEKNMPDLSTKEGRDLINKLLVDKELLILDNISCLFRRGGENESESWQEVQEWILEQRRKGKSVILVHHAGKSGKQRGTSKREDILDAVILLKRPEDYKPEEGARFTVCFGKARHFSGDEARSFQAQLRTENGGIRWEISDSPQEELITHIAQLIKEGLTIQQIMDETELTKSQVETRKKKAKEKGLL